MPYIAPEVVQEVKKMDLLTYLKNYEPHELVRFSGNTYTTRTHDSLKISNGKWMWWSRGIGGRSALDYLIKVEGYSFMEAVEIIVGQAAITPPVYVPQKEEQRKKKLLLPELSQYPEQVIQYLLKRGIDRDIIDFCINTGRICETRQYHNAGFIGKDSAGIPRYAALRGIDSDFIGDANGSDKRYSFAVPAEEKALTVHLFESPIDLLSYATMQKLEGNNWRAEHLLSLAGVYKPAKEIEMSKMPAALSQFLQEHTEIDTVVFHLDNDFAGRRAVQAIRTVLPKQYRTKDRPPVKGKDCNDCLCISRGLEVTRAREKKRMGGGDEPA